jgi:hypothetical protein
MNRTDHCPVYQAGGLVPAPGRACDGTRTLHTRDLHHVHGQRRARCVPDRGDDRGISRSLTDSLLASLTCGGPGQGGIIHDLLSSRSRVRVALGAPL